MSIEKEFPILEFDSDRKAKIDPWKVIETPEVPEHCVIAFFAEPIREMLEAGKLKQIATFYTATVNLPIYEMIDSGRKVVLILGFLGASGAAAQLEELIAMGCKKFIVCGAAGVLQKGIQVGHLIVPSSAVRDEGTSYHYLAPAREVECKQHTLGAIEDFLEKEKIPFIEAKTWTTDAFYRETQEKVTLRVSEGCVTVEMEAAALFAVAKYRDVDLGYLLFGGDDLSGVEWNQRKWTSREQIRRSLVELSIRACLEL